MKIYKIAFVGFGSIATRHLNNVYRFLRNRGDDCVVDLYRSSLNIPLMTGLESIVANSYLYTENIPKDRQYDIVFITNPTSMHYETILRFCKNTRSFFIEKPIFDSITVEKSFFDKISGVNCYVACPLRYNAVLQYIKRNLCLKDVYSVRAISSSYLPNWRQGQDYRNTYSAHKDLGGGVSIDLIHEWDYLIWLFGIPTECYRLIGKVSNLEIDSDDIAVYIGKNEKMTFELHLDYYGRKTIRTFDVFTNEDTIHCDLVGGTVCYLQEGKTITFNTERNTFQMSEIEHFFEIVEHKINNDSTPEHAYNVLKIAKGEN